MFSLRRTLTLLAVLLGLVKLCACSVDPHSPIRSAASHCQTQ